MHAILRTHADTRPLACTVGFSVLYAGLQTFCIPGSIFLSVLAGALFGFARGFVLVSLVASVGASNCYWIARLVGRDLVQHAFGARVAQLDALVRANEGHLVSYLLFLRLTPLLPNWSINIASPLIPQLRFRTFLTATALGMMPATAVYVHAGTTLASLSSVHEIASPKIVLALSGLGLIALLPAALARLGQ